MGKIDLVLRGELVDSFLWIEGDLVSMELIGFVTVAYHFYNTLMSSSAIENLLSSTTINIPKFTL